MSKVTRDELLEALTGFRLSVRTNRGEERGEIAEPETVADVLYATLSRIAAERAPDLGEADDPTSALDQIRTDIEDTVAVYNLDGPGKNSYPISAAMSLHARSLLAAIERVLELTRDSSGDDLYPSIDVTVGEVREAITSALSGTQQGEDKSHA